MKTSQGSDCITAGVRVRVTPDYIASESSPDDNRFLFAYRITIVNEGSEAVQLLSRIWRIVDADGETSVVRGDGVIGQQPTLAAGATYEYSSYCPLGTRWGTMEGTYRFRAAATNAEFDVEVARFYLVAGTENQTASTKQ